MKRKLWTIGYDGREPDELIAALQTARIDVLVDVRWTAHSRKRGYSKGGLSTALLDAHVEYRHLRLLGAPKELRDALYAGGDFQSFARAYQRHMTRQDDALEELERLCNTRRVAVLCREADAGSCYRGVLARHAEQHFDVAVEHL